MYPQSEPEPLEAWIPEQIRVNGPATVAQFIDWALYHPQFGYYTSGPNIGPRGDFITSPEASPAFGRLLARHVQEIDRLLGHPDRFDIIECGPGRGTLASDMLYTIKVEDADLYGRLCYRLVEVSPALAAIQRERLLPAHGSGVKWHSSLEEIPAGSQGTVIANELVDAFPVHVLENRNGTILEQYVTLDSAGDLVLTYLPTSRADLSRFLESESINLEEGERVEVNLIAEKWLQQVSSVFEAGVVTIIDYGDPAPQRYSSSRREGTLLAYYGGAVTDNILAHPGKQDITALVDFTALQHSAQRAHFDIAGMTRQANFLLGLGLGTTLTPEATTGSVEEALEYRRGLQALISMEGLGRFHVLLLSKGVDAKQVANLSALKYSTI
jgi:SAM-dependent MidA family methyltransferase